MNIFEHPDIKDLNPHTEREGLIYLKAAINATLTAAQRFGLDAVEDLHRRIERQLTKCVMGD